MTKTLSHPLVVGSLAVVAILCTPSTLGFTPLTAVRLPTAATTPPHTVALFATDPRHSSFPASPRAIVDAEIVKKHKIDGSSGAKEDRKRSTINPTPVLFSALQNVLPKSTSPATALLGAMLFLGTTLAATNPALAAMSGGRAGGGGYARSAPRMSRPMPSRSYGGGGYSRGYASPYGSTFRPNVFLTPSPTIIAPFGPPIVPYYGGVGVLPMVRRGPSFFDIMFFGAITFMIVNTIRGAGQSDTDGAISNWSTDSTLASPLGTGTTVAQISVALQVPNRDDQGSILSVLNRMASSSNTNKRSGLQNLTSQVALELLRRKSNIVSASTSYDHYRDRTRAEQAFGQRAIRERSKFEQETFNRFRGSDWSNPRQASRDEASDKATVAVVTLLIEIDGDSTKLPRVSSLANVEEALQKIASDARVGDCLQSAEILWTPEDRAESLSLRDVVADYPELRTV
jgi:uncharacterized membrane protein